MNTPRAPASPIERFAADSSGLTAADPYHGGEHALQARAGVRERMAQVGPRMIRGHMPDEHRELFGKLPFVLIGSVDAAGQPHASLLAGAPGFMITPDARTLSIATWPEADDPLRGVLRAGAPVGVLGIEPHTRRRNRANGVVTAVRDGGFSIQVQQSFGNCPKYIQARQARWLGAAPAGVVRDGTRLDAAAAAIVRGADTFFIATSALPAQLAASPAHGGDVSHRGGKPGFVRVQRDADGTDTLTVPDFAGNNVFNTLGNLAEHPRAGLLFVDFDRGDLVHLSVDARVEWSGPDLDAFAGALRLLQLRVRAVRHRCGAARLAWSDAQASPFVHGTGEWVRAAA